MRKAEESLEAEEMVGSSSTGQETSFQSHNTATADRSKHCSSSTLEPGIVAAERCSSFNTVVACSHRLYGQRGLVSVLLCTVFMALQGVLVSLLKLDLASTEIVAIRFWITTAIVVPLLVYQGVPFLSSKQNLKYHILRSVSGTVNVTVRYFAYQNMRVGDATAILYGTPAFTSLFGRIFLKEPFHVLDLVFIITTIAGVFIVAQPPFLFPSSDVLEEESNSLVGILAAVISMILTSVNFVILRFMGKRRIKTFQGMLYFGVIGGVGTTGVNAGISGWILPDCGRARYLLIVIGVSAFLGQALITYALTVENAIFVSMCRTNEIIAAFILQFLILGIPPNLLSGLGAILIIMTTVLLSIRKILQQRHALRQLNEATEMNSRKEEEEETPDDELKELHNL